jgi:transcriptional regulator with XRE-family HTH domain
MNNTIGNKLKMLRKQKGLSQEQVSEQLHISQSAYARIEKGESNSWAMHLDKIATLYDIKPEDLVKNELRCPFIYLL